MWLGHLAAWFLEHNGVGAVFLALFQLPCVVLDEGAGYTFGQDISEQLLG